jgi:hypothetical protein
MTSILSPQGLIEKGSRVPQCIHADDTREKFTDTKLSTHPLTKHCHHFHHFYSRN